MIIKVKGSVTKTGQNYFNCTGFDELLVKVYSAGLNSLSADPIDTITVAEDGKFNKDVSTTAKNLVAKLFFHPASGTDVEITTSGLFCHHDEINLAFEYDDAKYGEPVYAKVLAKVGAVETGTGNVNPNTVSQLTDEEIKKLECLACLSSVVLKRLVDSNKLWTAFSALTFSGEYTDVNAACNYLKSNEALTRELFFGFAKFKPGASLAQILTYSESQLNTLKGDLFDNNEVNPAYNSSGAVDFWMKVRNGLLFNSNNDDGLLDAKLIHMASGTYADKASLFNQCLTQGGLDVLIDPNPSNNSALLNRIADLKIVGGHTENHPPFLQKVATAISGTPDYYDLTLQGPNYWSGLMTSAGDRPTHYASNGDYANAIFQSIASGQPSARAAKALVSSGITDASAIRAVLINGINRQFNIKEQGTNDFFTVKASPNAANPNEVTREMLDKIQALQRTIKLSGDTDNLSVTKVLLDAGKHSSYAISKMGRAPFFKLMTDHGVPLDKTESIYASARGIFETLTLMAVQHKLYDNPNANLPEAARGSGAYLPGGSVSDNLPDLESIFGTLNTCECSECQSVYSPAAYLTDMLNWLYRDVAADSPFSVAYDCLVNSWNTNNSTFYNRRSDIALILLCCPNTNTLMPYIDLVNEILTQSISDNVMVGTPDYTYMQTTKTQEELLVEPEHRKPNVETNLNLVAYPWTLPYDPSYYESLVYLKELKKPYHQLINDFSSDTAQYNNSDWAYAYLEMNPAEAAIITSNTNVNHPNGFWDFFWAFNLIGASTPKVNPVMEVAELKLAELKDLLQASYIEPTAVLSLVPDTADICDFDKYSFNPSFTKARADRFMRFLRLKRKTGLTTLELDLAIKNLSAGGVTLDAAFVRKLASAMAFCHKYNLNFLDHQIWFSALAYTEIWNSNDSDFYKNKFQNPLLSDKIRNFFSTSGTTGTFLHNSSVLNNNNERKQMLSSVLKISIPAINYLLTHLSITTALTKSTLAKLDKYSQLINIFKLDVKEIAAIFKLIGDPLDTVINPDTLKAVWEFERNLAKLKALETNPNDLIDIVEGTGYYATAANGAAVNADFDKEAKACWEKVEFAYQESIKANPDKLFNGAAGPNAWLPVNPADTTFYNDVVLRNFLLPFKINLSDAYDVIVKYNSDNSVNWLSDYIKRPIPSQASVTKRDWDINRKMREAFTPVYKLFKRIQLISDICGLDVSGISYAVKNVTLAPNPLPVAPQPHQPFILSGTPFYWIGSTYPTADVFNLFWIKSLSTQASEFKLFKATAPLKTSQELYFEEATLYCNLFHYGPNPYELPEISNLYDMLGADSKYRRLSVQEFIELFVRAENKKDNPIADDFNEIIEKMNRFMTASEDLEIKFIDAWSWVWTNAAGTLASLLSGYSADIRRVLNTHYPNFKSWSNFIVPIQNNFRMKLRDALVAYHIGELGYKDDKALYSYFLIDNQMSPCMLTTRIVAAISSVQLLIHRALLGLEPEIRMTNTDKKEWEWRKNYRVWEANRKVFLYPENWIDPTLRRNKSYLFKEAEEFLLQDDINAKNTELAYAGYLTGLNDMARLDVRAVYNEYEYSSLNPPVTTSPGDKWAGWNDYEKNSTEKMHVFARTWNPPYTYYHRYRYQGIWSPWEKIDVEIDSDHLIPIVFNRKLYLYFPIFIEKVYNNHERRKYYEIKMAYIKYDYGKWSGKKVLDGKVLAGENIYKRASLENTEENLYVLTAVNYYNDYNNTYYWYPHFPDISLRNEYTFKKSTNSNDNHFEVYDHNNKYQSWWDYYIVSLKKEHFYFWGKILNNGDLAIEVRRLLNLDYLGNTPQPDTQFVFNQSFIISASDERVRTYRPSEPANGLGLINRPYNTLPYYQQIVNPKDPYLGNSNSLFVRDNQSTNSMPLFSSTNGKHYLTYPHQYMHAHYFVPMFYHDDRRNFMISPRGNVFYYNMYFDVAINEHPLAWKMMAALNKFGVEGLLNASDTNLKRQQEVETHPYDLDLPNPNGTNLSDYQPTWILFPNPLPDLDYDFSTRGTYSHYNWEVFFHMVSLIGRQLKQNNKFADAFKWLGYIFDPNNRDNMAPLSQNTRYWKIKPFLIDVTQGSIQKMMRTLASPTTAANYQEKVQIISQITAWRNNPFDPHVIANLRPRAYMMWTMMEFIENIIDWADSFFRQDTMESINEALNLYILASQLLGKKPKKVSRPNPACKSFNDIVIGLDPFSNLFVEFENLTVTVPGPVWVSEGGGSGIVYTGGDTGTDVGVAGTTVNISVVDLYFCIPDNPKLAALWDKVEDRLFKIRHCMNIDGKRRELALFSAPIDPALLVKAVAAGLSVEDALADLAAPMPHYRFSYLLQKANEFNNEVKALGSQLLGLLEKKDAEELSVFRQVHEQNILNASRALKQMAIEEAKQNLATLQASKNLIQIRLADYENRQYTNSRELAAQNFTKKSENQAIAEQGVRAVAGLLNLIPDVYLSANPGTKAFGGSKISTLVSAGANVLGIYSTINRNKSSMSLTFASYDRRQEDWDLQKKTAKEELLQVDRQILSSQIRIAVTEKELANHDLQVAQSQEMYEWLKDKFTNGKLYSWMSGQVKSVYKQMFNLAYDMAKRAQICMDYELGSSGTNIVQYGQWDGSKAGLLAGERLALQLKQLETQYIKNNERELELSKNISLALLNPNALEDLIITGSCAFELPELLFDLDHPGHFMRRIKSVSISIPCITGSNTNINAILSITDAKIRKTAEVTGAYTPTSPDPIPLESIATSGAQNDSGLFELNFKDERYLPFEGKGAVSKWTLELSQVARTGKTTLRSFDFETISDVVIHMKYTARYDGGLATKVKTNINTVAANNTLSLANGVFHAFSLKHDMPNEWNEFKTTGTVNYKIEKNRLPYLIQAFAPKITELTFIPVTNSNVTAASDLRINGTLTAGVTAYTVAQNPVRAFILSKAFGPALSLSTTLSIGDHASILAADITDMIIIAKLEVS